jgi:hypothetical protein
MAPRAIALTRTPKASGRGQPTGKRTTEQPFVWIQSLRTNSSSGGWRSSLRRAPRSNDGWLAAPDVQPILCMTKPALESEWVRVERNTATFRDPANHDRRFLPLLFEDCTVPAMLRRVKYIDWRSESAAAWQQLQAHLQPGAEPLPELPKEEWNPYDPYTPALGSGFVGRKEELRRLQQAMEMSHSVSVVGDWRIGKTSLLAAFAARARAAGRVVRHLSGEGPEGGSLAAFVRQVTGISTRSVSEGQGRRDKSLANASGWDDLSADDAADHLSEWAEAHSSHGSKPVLIVDESERLIETFDYRFFDRVRGCWSG